MDFHWMFAHMVLDTTSKLAEATWYHIHKSKFSSKASRSFGVVPSRSEQTWAFAAAGHKVLLVKWNFQFLPPTTSDHPVSGLPMLCFLGFRSKCLSKQCVFDDFGNLGFDVVPKG